MKRTVERIEMKRIGGGADARALMSRIAQRILLIPDYVKRHGNFGHEEWVRCHRNSMFGACAMKVSVTLISVTWLVLLGQSAFGNDADCSLSVENAQLCLARDKSSKECLPLDANRHENVEQFRCLIRSFGSIEHCKGVTIAQNIFVLLRPFAVRYEGLLFRNPSKQFYSREHIQSSCRTR